MRPSGVRMKASQECFPPYRTLELDMIARRLSTLLASCSSLALAAPAFGLALTGLMHPAAAQSDNPAPVVIPPISVGGAAPTGNGGDYKVDAPTQPKLTEPILDTPQTINVVPRQLMDDQGATTMRDALRNVPGISLAAGEASAQGDSLTIRGFTARSDIYLDNMRDFGSYYRDPFFLDGIQVLKGPSSILFGRGSTGGIIEQDSKMPLLAPFTNGTAAVGTDGTKRATADIGRPLPSLGIGAAFRVNLMVHDSEVAGRDSAEYSRFGIAPSLVLGLGTNTRSSFTYLHQTEYDTPDYGLPWLYQGTTGQGSGVAHPAQVQQNNFYGFNNNDYLRTNVDIVTAKVEHDFNESVTLRDQVRYAHYLRSFRITEPQLYTVPTAPGATGVSALVGPGTSLASLSVSRNELYGASLETFMQNQTDLTLKFGTGFIDHTVVTGIEIGREVSDPDRYSTIGPYSTTPLLSPTPGQTYNAQTYFSSKNRTTADTQAAYALDTLKLSEQWQVMAGLRLDRFDATVNTQTFANPVTNAGASVFNTNHVDNLASWRGGIVYKPAPNGSVYFDAGTSFDPSAEQLSLTAANASLAPVKNTTYEVGTKWEMFHENLLVTGSIYQTQQKNVRETDPNNSNFMILAGDAIAKGFEFGAAGHLTERWQVTAGYAYTYSVIDKSPNSGPTSDLGHRLGNVPEHTANLWTTYLDALGQSADRRRHRLRVEPLRRDDADHGGRRQFLEGSAGLLDAERHGEISAERAYRPAAQPLQPHRRVLLRPDPPLARRARPRPLGTVHRQLQVLARLGPRCCSVSPVFSARTRRHSAARLSAGPTGSMAAPPPAISRSGSRTTSSFPRRTRRRGGSAR